MDFLGTANLMWSSHWPEEEPLSKDRTEPHARGPAASQWQIAPERGRRRGATDRHRESRECARGWICRSSQGAHGSGRVEVRGDRRRQGESKHASAAERPIPIGADVSSIVFLHASAKGAANDMSYRYIHNFPDTADLLGWYEVVYEDGFRGNRADTFRW